MTAPTLPPVSADVAAEASLPDSALVRVRRFARQWWRAARRLFGTDGRWRSAWVIGAIAALWAWSIGVVLAVLVMTAVWLASAGSGESAMTWLQSVRVAGLIWVVAHGAPILIGGITYSLIPWGLALVPVLLAVYAGDWAARTARITRGRDVVVLAGSATLTYALGGVVVATLSNLPDGRVNLVDALVHAVVLCAAAFTFGACRACRLSLDRMLPRPVAVTLRAGIVGSLVLLGCGAVAAAVALALRIDDAVTLAQSLHPGALGGLGLLLLGIAYVPVLIVWSSAYLVGAGVMLGPAMTVSPFLNVSGSIDLPPFPLLAAVPQSTSAIGWAMPLVGVLAGIVAGVLISRSARAESRLLRLTMALGAATLTACVMAVLCYLTTGALGDLRLASLGPPSMTVAVLVFVLATFGAVPMAVLAATATNPRLAVADPSPQAGGERSTTQHV